jgi:phage-related protein
MGVMIFNGISTVDLGVVIQSPPVYAFPNRDYEITHVEGKNGAIVIDKGSYQNVARTYYLAAVFRPSTSFVMNASTITAWLMAQNTNGYARLEDSYEPEYYRMALYKDANTMMNYYDLATTLQVTFECKPQRYLKSGDTLINVNTLDSYVCIVNPTTFIALPEIVIDGTGETGNDLTINFYKGPDHDNPINTSNVVVSFVGEGVIDSELQECYSTSEYLNNDVTLSGGFPKLYPGINWIKITGKTLTKFTIKPRWWTL